MYQGGYGGFTIDIKPTNNYIWFHQFQPLLIIHCFLYCSLQYNTHNSTLSLQSHWYGELHLFPHIWVCLKTKC